MARAVGTLLVKAGLSIGILGEKETCEGNEVRALGESGLFQQLAEQNIRTFQGLGVKKIITLDPHAYNAFKNDYPPLGGEFEVYHYTQVLAPLIEGGGLLLKESRSAVTYHDPCYLGRHNGEYEAPRSILKAVPGLELIEMERYGENSFCCGGGGGNFFTDILGGGEESPARLRVREALDTGAGVIAVACPQCLKMLEDAVKAEEMEGRLQVMDIAEIVTDCLT
jgi:Fe-S oxidoreductase